MNQVIFIKSQMQEVVQKLENGNHFDNAALLEEIVENYSKFAEGLLKENQ